mmetsp:Transcript_19609/g.75242  ORF Transcript_19609/g.75242 Transcript_19609/m.75242 type:complete len:204 (+) Transcript_19609:406-1017(+)
MDASASALPSPAASPALPVSALTPTPSTARSLLPTSLMDLSAASRAGSDVEHVRSTARAARRATGTLPLPPLPLAPPLPPLPLAPPAPPACPPARALRAGRRERGAAAPSAVSPLPLLTGGDPPAPAPAPVGVRWRGEAPGAAACPAGRRARDWPYPLEDTWPAARFRRRIGLSAPSEGPLAPAARRGLGKRDSGCDSPETRS